jgi:hypothetical protein
LEGNWGFKQFISPVDFMVIEKINFSQFRLNKWYAIILFNGIEREDEMLSLNEFIDEKNEVLSFLKKHSLKNPEIGETLMDGGKKVKFLYQYLGKQNYMGLLNRVFV